MVLIWWTWTRQTLTYSSSRGRPGVWSLNQLHYQGCPQGAGMFWKKSWEDGVDPIFYVFLAYTCCHATILLGVSWFMNTYVLLNHVHRLVYNILFWFAQIWARSWACSMLEELEILQVTRSFLNMKSSVGRRCASSNSLSLPYQEFRILDLLLITCYVLIVMYLYIYIYLFFQIWYTAYLSFGLKLAQSRHTHAPMRHPAIRTHKKDKQRVELGSLKNRSTRDRYFPTALKISPSRKKWPYFSFIIWIHWFNFDGLNLICFRDSWRKELFHDSLPTAQACKSQNREIVWNGANNHLRRCSNVTCFPTAVLWHPEFLWISKSKPQMGQGRSAIVDGINLDVPEAKYFGVCNSRSGTWGILAVFGKKAMITFFWSWNVRTMLPWCFECNLESSQNLALSCYQSPDLQFRLATLVRALATFSQPWFCVQIILQARHKETLESGVSQEHVKQQPQSRVGNKH